MNGLDAAISRLDAIIETEPDYAEALSVYRAVIKTFEAFLRVGDNAERLRSLCDGIALPEDVASRLRDGAPVLERSCFLAVTPFADDFLRFLRSSDEMKGRGANDLVDAIRGEGLRLAVHFAAEAVRRRIADERRRRDKGGEREARGTARCSGRFDEEWGRKDCPICGSTPSVAALFEDSSGETLTRRRLLLCSFCATEWTYKRIGCARCECEDQSRLHYISVGLSSAAGEVGGESMYRIDLCDECHGYMKTVVWPPHEASAARIEATPVLYIEDIATPHLDQIALERGYTAGKG